MQRSVEVASVFEPGSSNISPGAAMKRTILAGSTFVLAISAVSALITGCGSKQDPPPQQPAAFNGQLGPNGQPMQPAYGQPAYGQPGDPNAGAYGQQPAQPYGAPPPAMQPGMPTAQQPQAPAPAAPAGDRPQCRGSRPRGALSSRRDRSQRDEGRRRRGGRHASRGGRAHARVHLATGPLLHGTRSGAPSHHRARPARSPPSRSSRARRC